MTDAPLHVGDHVEDRDDPGAAMLVVAIATETAADYEIAQDGFSVADANPRYPEDDTVVEVVYPQRTDADLEGKRRYAFPQSRLRRVAAVHDVEDADGELATDA